MKSTIYFILLSTLFWGPAASAASLDFSLNELPLDSLRSGTTWAQLDDDGRLDLLATDDSNFKIYLQREDGTYDETPSQIIHEERGALYDIVDIDRDGIQEIYLLHRDGVDRYIFDAAAKKVVLDPIPILDRMRGVPIQHLAPADFLFDIDTDGDEDLVYPIEGKYFLYFQEDGKFAMKNKVATKPVRISMEFQGENLRETLKSRIVIPRLAFSDVNNDGRLDLRVSNDNRESFYLQTADGQIPEKESYGVELKRFKDQQVEQSSQVDVDQFQFIPLDINADGLQDYTIVASNKLWVFMQTEDGVDFENPDQILKVSAEYMSVIMLPISDDDKLDLVIMKYQIPSIGRLVAGLAIGLKFEIEFLGYPQNNDPVFVRRPENQSVFVFKVPPIFKMLGELDNIVEDFRNVRRRAHSTTGGDFNGDGITDVVKIAGDELELYISPEASEDVKADFYADMGGAEMFRDTLFGEPRREVDVATIVSFISDIVDTFQANAIQGLPPAGKLAISDDITERVLSIDARDLNGDGIDDIIVLLGPEEGQEFADGETQSMLYWLSKR